MGFLIPPLYILKFLIHSDLKGLKFNGSKNSQVTSSDNMSYITLLFINVEGQLVGNNE